MPNYKQKLTNPLVETEFTEAMQTGHFVQTPQHQGLVAFVYYTGVRISEALAMTRSQFRITTTDLFCDIGPRKKKKKFGKDGKPKKPTITDPLPIPLELPYVKTIEDCLLGLKPEMKVWPYCRTTGWNIVKRAGLHYPHYGRLSAITNFLLEGYTIPEIKSWFGITATAIDYYVGKIALLKMSKALARRHHRRVGVS